MRFCFLFLMLMGLLAGLPTESSEGSKYPFWDGKESIRSYAKRVGLPETKEIRLGGGVRLEMVLVPAGQFIKGTPPPERPDLIPLIEQKFIGIYFCLAATACLAVMCFFVMKWSRLARHRTQYSLARFMVMAVVGSIALLGGLHWNGYAARISNAEHEYEAAVQRWESADMSEKSVEHAVIPRPFYLGKYEVTQEQFETVTGYNPSGFRGVMRPVEKASWMDAQDFCVLVIGKTRQRLRLPTDTEWEYACRAGTRSTFHLGDDIAALDRSGWYKDNSDKGTHEVGGKQANRLGLYDMHGNVSEWCGDGLHKDVFDYDSVLPFSCRWVRGGSWLDEDARCRVAFRHAIHEETSGRDLGFRVALDGVDFVIPMERRDDPERQRVSSR